VSQISNIVVSSFCCALLLKSQPAPASCPVFTPDTTIAKISPSDRILRFAGGFVAIVNEVRLDTDGSPVAWAWNPQSTRTAAAVFGDTQSKFGEISIAFAQELQKGAINPITPSALAPGGAVPWPYGRKASGDVRLVSSPSGPVVFVYFSALPTPALSNFDAPAINTSVQGLVNTLGGTESLKQCLGSLLRSH
jgi:hypothetical protein